jgi:hypothetical protein
MFWPVGAPVSQPQTEETASAGKLREVADSVDPVQASVAPKRGHQMREAAARAAQLISLEPIRPIFLAVITISQAVGALMFFSYVYEVARRSPSGTLNALQLLDGLAHILMYLAGLIGAVLIWVRKPAGLWLSFVHQLLMVPLWWTPGWVWVVADWFGIAVWFARNDILERFFFSIEFDLSGTLQVLHPVAGVSYYGANVFALMCALYLYQLRRRRVFVAGVDPIIEAARSWRQRRERPVLPTDPSGESGSGQTRKRMMPSA